MASKPATDLVSSTPSRLNPPSLSSSSAGNSASELDFDVDSTWFAADERYALHNRPAKDSTIYEKYVVDIQTDSDEEKEEDKERQRNKEAQAEKKSSMPNQLESEDEQDSATMEEDADINGGDSASLSDLFSCASFGELHSLKILSKRMSESSSCPSSTCPSDSALNSVLCSQDTSGMSLLHSAAPEGNLPIFRWILSHLDSTSALHLLCCLDHSHRTVFHYLSGGGHGNVIAFLFEFLRQKDKTLLFSEEHLKRLLNVADLSGMTALHWAERHGFESVSRLLILNGADMRMKDMQGKTAVEWVNKLKSTQEISDIRNSMRGTHGGETSWKRKAAISIAAKEIPQQNLQPNEAKSPSTSTGRKSVKFADDVEGGDNEEEDADRSDNSSPAIQLHRNIDPLDEETAIYSTHGNNQTVHSNSDTLQWVQRLSTATAADDYFRQRLAEESEGDDSDIEINEEDLGEGQHDMETQREGNEEQQEEFEDLPNGKLADPIASAPDAEDETDELDGNRSRVLFGDSDEDDDDADADEKKSTQMNIARLQEIRRARAAVVRGTPAIQYTHNEPME